jgi:hypothetical protein
MASTKIGPAAVQLVLPIDPHYLALGFDISPLAQALRFLSPVSHECSAVRSLPSCCIRLHGSSGCPAARQRPLEAVSAIRSSLSNSDARLCRIQHRMEPILSRPVSHSWQR